MLSMRTIVRETTLGLGIAMAASALVDAQEPPPRPFLRNAIKLDDAQLAALERGEAVTKQLPVTEKAEIAVFGAQKVRGTPATFLQRVRDIQNFRKVPQVPQIGHFSNPPRIEDLAGLTWEKADLDALKVCKPGKCDVKIGSAGLDRLAKEINWSAPDAYARAEALAKQQMLAYVTSYLAGGTGAMGLILDKQNPRALSAEFGTLLKNSPYAFEYIPAFAQYLEAYPKGKLANTEDVLYWTKDTFGLKPVVTIYHATLHTQEGKGTIVAIKTLYASHYFNAGLELLSAVPTADGAGMYYMNLYRTRIDPPTGMLAGTLLGRVRNGVQQGVSENLKVAKTRIEAP